MTKPQVITAISNLLHNRAIKKISEEPLNATDGFFDETSKTTKKRTKHQYEITKAGLRKLAYLEWKYSLHIEWDCPWSDAYNDRYYSEMTEIITKDLKLPI